MYQRLKWGGWKGAPCGHFNISDRSSHKNSVCIFTKKRFNPTLHVSASREIITGLQIGPLKTEPLLSSKWNVCALVRVHVCLFLICMKEEVDGICAEVIWFPSFISRADNSDKYNPWHMQMSQNAHSRSSTCVRMHMCTCARVMYTSQCLFSYDLQGCAPCLTAWWNVQVCTCMSVCRFMCMCVCYCNKKTGLLGSDLENVSLSSRFLKNKRRKGHVDVKIPQQRKLRSLKVTVSLRLP